MWPVCTKLVGSPIMVRSIRLRRRYNAKNITGRFHVTLCYVMLCYNTKISLGASMLCYAMLCNAMLSYAMSFYVMLS